MSEWVCLCVCVSVCGWAGAREWVGAWVREWVRGCEGHGRGESGLSVNQSEFDPDDSDSSR